MGAPFRDITLYSPTETRVGTDAYKQERALLNYVSDLYIQYMRGYKPPNTTRVTIEPSYYGIWKQTWKIGSLKLIATYFNYQDFLALSKKGKYLYTLDVIHKSMLELSDEYEWDRAVFENAYAEMIKNDFVFRIEYPSKMSRDRRKAGGIVIEKSDLETTLFVNLITDTAQKTVKLFHKKNWWRYDKAYSMAKAGKWFDNNRFGIEDKYSKWKVWYDLMTHKVAFEKEDVLLQENSPELNHLFLLHEMNQ